MFRMPSKLLHQIVHQFKIKPIVTLQTNGRAILCVSNFVVKPAFYTTESKQASSIKSPLSSLIGNDAATTTETVKETTEEEDREKREQSWRKMKLTLAIFGVSFTCLGVYLIFELGKPRLDEFGLTMTDKYSKMPLVKQYLYRTIGELNYYGQLLKEPSRDKLLPDPISHPYYQPKYTVVLEFTDVLVHPSWSYQTGWRFKKRPGIDHFLESLSGTYEIVIYTAEQGMTVFPIVEALDPKNHINYKLVRDATLFIDGEHVKDMDKLNRDLSKVILVDWNGESTKYHPENVLQIPRWKGNDEDLTLIHLSSFLLAIAQTGIEDVREVVTYYNQFPDPLVTFREKQRKMIELAESQEETAQISQTKKVGTRWTPSFFKKS